MPFGLRNTLAAFQRLMDSVLAGLQGNELFVYLDDIVVYAASLREHEIKFNKLAAKLRTANIRLQSPDADSYTRRLYILGAYNIRERGEALPRKDNNRPGLPCSEKRQEREGIPRPRRVLPAFHRQIF